MDPPRGRAAGNSYITSHTIPAHTESNFVKVRSCVDLRTYYTYTYISSKLAGGRSWSSGMAFTNISMLTKHRQTTEKPRQSPLILICILLFQYELLFCIQDEEDSRLRMYVESLRAKYPKVDCQVSELRGKWIADSLQKFYTEAFGMINNVLACD